MNLMNKAHGRMLVKQGLLAADDYRKIASGLDTAYRELCEQGLSGGKEDLSSYLTDRMYELIGEETGCRLHLGRSRNDMIFTTVRMEFRKTILELLNGLHDLEQTILETEKENLDTVITYYTYGQPAQPGTYAHYLNMLLNMLTRDFERLQLAYRHTNLSPMGAATGIGTGYPLDRAYTAELLGFDGVVENTMEALSDADYMLEIEAAVAILMSTLSRAAQDLYFWASDECRTLECDSAISGGSSIMPQKRNPEAIEYIRVKSAHPAAALMDGLMLNRNTTLFPSIEVIETEMQHWNNLHEALVSIGEFADVLHHVKVRKEEAYRRATENFSGAATMAEELAQKYGIPFTQTHHVIYAMIHKLIEENRLDVKNMTGELFTQTAQKVLGKAYVISDAEIAAMLDPMHGLEEKKTGGTPKRADMQALVEKNEAALEQQKTWLAAQQEKIARAYAAIDAAI